MRRGIWFPTAFFLCLAAVPANSEAADKGSGLYWLVYDTKVPGALKVCTKEQLSTIANCPAWNPDVDFFETGSLIRLRILNGKLLSTYSVVVNGIAVADSLPQIRGVDSATTAQSPATTPPTPSPAPPVPGDENTQFLVLQGAFSRATQILTDGSSVVASYEGQGNAEVTGVCAPRADVNPRNISVKAILAFATTLGEDLTSCTSGAINEGVFTNLTDRTDHLNQSVTALNGLLATVQQAITSAQNEWTSYTTAESAFRMKFPMPSPDERPYLQGGANYAALKQKADSLASVTNRLPGEIAQISLQEASVFNSINAVFDGAYSTRSIDISIGQYTTGFAAEFEIHENPNFVRYAFASASQANPGGGQPTPMPVGGAGPMPSPVGVGGGGAPVKPGGGGANPNQPQGTSPQTAGSPGAQGKFIYAGNFEVHHLYRANLVSGFFWSTLKTRTYGVSSTTATPPVTTATIGGQHIGQLHYYVGIDYYAFKRRDLFPGAMKPRDYAFPSLFVGYGADQTNNFLLGPNWELKWGLTLGMGAHVGQETFLSAGTIPGVTPLGTATTAPTTNHSHVGAFFSVGFDLSVFKAAFGQAAGGGGAASTTPASASPSPGGKTKGN